MMRRFLLTLACAVMGAGLGYTVGMQRIAQAQVTESHCGDSIDNDSDTLMDCADNDCDTDPLCNGGECGYSNHLAMCSGTCLQPQHTCSTYEAYPCTCVPDTAEAGNGTCTAIQGCGVRNGCPGVLFVEGCGFWCDWCSDYAAELEEVWEGGALDCTSDACVPCGDGVVVGTEQCDDGNTANGDGCSKYCKNEGSCNNNGACTGGETCSNCPADCGSCPSSVCDNDGSVDAGETCSNCPFDVRCTAAQKCIAGACSSASWSCKREDVCGDGWLSDFEECDDGGICTGSVNASLNGQLCFDLDPMGEKSAGIARCRATGGICVAQNGDGCTSDCQTECHEDGAPCLLASDCCGSSCVDGTCDAGGGGPEICNNGIDDDSDTLIDCADVGDCPDATACGVGGTCSGGNCVGTTCGACPGCDPSSIDKWTVTIAGLAAGSCDGGLDGGSGDCASFNGTFTLDLTAAYSFSNCSCGWCWHSTGGANECAGVGPKWTLTFNHVYNRWQLVNGGNSGDDTSVVYAIPNAQWSCSSANILTKVSSEECSGWPATVTVSPATGAAPYSCPLP